MILEKSRQAFTCVIHTLIVLALMIALVPAAHAISESSFTAEDIPDASLTPKKSYQLPTNDLHKKLSPGVAKVIIRLHGVPISTGSGFFASKTGLLITNYNVIRPALLSSAYAAEVVLHDKKVIRDLKIAACGDARGIDLCALKLDVEPKYSFVIAREPASEADPATLIGHPRNMDFSISRGEFVKYVTSPKGISEIEYKATLAPGNAGGPIFNDQGRLIGIAGRHNPDNPEVQTGFSATELETFLLSETQAKPIAEARQAHLERSRTEMRTKAAKELDPAIAFAMKSKSLTGLKGFREVSFKFDNRLLKVQLPDFFETCAFSQKTRESTVHACQAAGDRAVFSVQRLPIRGHEELLAKNGKKLLDSKPLQIVESLQQDNDWELYEEMLSPEQQRAFNSNPQPAQCQRTRLSKLKNAAFSEVPACRFVVTNDTDVGGQSVNVWLLKDQYLFAVTVWMNESTLSEYLWRVPILAILTSQWDKAAEETANPRALAAELSRKPLPTYAIELPETVSFMGSKIEKGGRQLDLYGKKLLLDKFEEGHTIAVSAEKKSYLPPDFDEITRKAASQSGRTLGASLEVKTIEVEAITIAHRPSRLLTAFGKDKKGRDVMVFTGVVFFEDDTYQITQVSTSKDPADSFKEFRRLLLGFKRK